MIAVAITVSRRGPNRSHTAAAGNDTSRMDALVVASSTPDCTLERSKRCESSGTSGTYPFHKTSPAKIAR